jgi:hypothetical protein
VETIKEKYVLLFWDADAPLILGHEMLPRSLKYPILTARDVEKKPHLAFLRARNRSQNEVPHRVFFQAT